MIAHSFAGLLSDLGMQHRFSRLTVSNANPVGERQFKSTKCWPSDPGRFQDARQARPSCQTFVLAYSQQTHEGPYPNTPEKVYRKQLEVIWKIRQAGMEKHAAA